MNQTGNQILQDDYENAGDMNRESAYHTFCHLIDSCKSEKEVLLGVDILFNDGQKAEYIYLFLNTDADAHRSLLFLRDCCEVLPP